MAEITIRLMRADDLDQPFFNPQSRQYGETWLEYQERDQALVAVAECDGLPVARVGLEFAPDKSAAHISAAHVEAEYQSRGIGTALFGYLEQVALQRGFSLMHVDVGKDNPRAQKLYERLGYEVFGEGVIRWSYRDGDDIIEVADDVWHMRKTLTSQE